MRIKFPQILSYQEWVDLWNLSKVDSKFAELETAELHEVRSTVLSKLLQNKELLIEIESAMVRYAQEYLIENPPIYLSRARIKDASGEYLTAKTILPLVGGKKKEIRIYLGKQEDILNHQNLGTKEIEEKIQDVALSKMKEKLKNRFSNGTLFTSHKKENLSNTDLDIIQKRTIRRNKMENMIIKTRKNTGESNRLGSSDFPKEFNGVKIIDPETLTAERKREQFLRLIQTIDLRRKEDYDCSTLNVWSYRQSIDVREGINIKFGNMCNGYPFVLAGVPFIHSEGAYIAGYYSQDDEHCQHIQQDLSKDGNARTCKRKYRNNKVITVHSRQDFYSYNVQWMLYVLWQKCKHNEGFSDLVKKIPVDAHLVENTTGFSDRRSKFWGAHNKELHNSRKLRKKEVEIINKAGRSNPKTQMLAANAINDIGVFSGVNCMGKIIKVCQLSLLHDVDPPIDYELLASKDLYICGRRIEFPQACYEDEMMTFINNARG